jgi:hypothetical protein
MKNPIAFKTASGDVNKTLNIFLVKTVGSINLFNSLIVIWFSSKPLMTFATIVCVVVSVVGGTKLSEVLKINLFKQYLRQN